MSTISIIYTNIIIQIMVIILWSLRYLSQPRLLYHTVASSRTQTMLKYHLFKKTQIVTQAKLVSHVLDLLVLFCHRATTARAEAKVCFIKIKIGHGFSKYK